MSTSIPPTSSTFSFAAPFPPASSSTPAPATLKSQRRVSLALPSSPRQFAAWSFRDDTTVGAGPAGVSSPSALAPEKKGKIRRIASENDHDDATSVNGTILQPPTPVTGSSTTGDPPKKPRKKWTKEETQMLVDGCNKWGVGNWKSILNDPELKFDNRSPVDLKDRFRTYFPDAYKHHYPNARTHLSSKTRSTHPDGTPLFCASRSKKRRPFTPEEDAALKAGYDKHGTVWATIVKDPIFQEQNRRSTDLRDRFRNAWPELYAKAGYKPRASAGKKKRGEGDNGVATVEQTGRVQPQRAATDDQLPTTSAMGGPVRRKRRHTTQGFGLFRGGTESVPESIANSEDEDSCSDDEAESSQLADHAGASMDMDMEMSNQDSSVPDFISSSSLSMSDVTDSSQSHSQTAQWSDMDASSHPWSSSRTPNQAFADSLAASPTPSNDYLLPHSPVGFGSATGMIGKSAWGPQDWLSPNPRLAASGTSTSSSTSFAGGLFSPLASPSLYSAQPHSLSLAHVSLNQLAMPNTQSHGLGGFQHSHGVLDRYDLFPLSHDLDLDFVSEGFDGTGDAHSAFSDPSAWAGTSDMRRGGFTHHSNYAGDLIFGARTHQPTGHTRMDYGPGFGFGLGLEGVQPQSVLHTPALAGIDEIELTNINLNDPADAEQELPMGMVVEDHTESLGSVSRESDLVSAVVASPTTRTDDTFTPIALEEIVGIPPPEPNDPHHNHVLGDQVQDTSNHVTPPATPATAYRATGRTNSFGNAHHRSISVPPSEHRAYMPPRSGQSQVVSPKGKHKPLVATPTRHSFGPSHLQSPTITASSMNSAPPPAPQAPPPPPAVPPSMTSWSLPHPSDADIYGLPFLDLHYYYPGSDPPDGTMDLSRPHGAQALDLAQSFAQLHPHNDGTKHFGISPALMQAVPENHATTGHTRVPSTHHRGQSVAAVSPQDLLLRKGNDNKRKRASWDGGPR